MFVRRLRFGVRPTLDFFVPIREAGQAAFIAETEGEGRRPTVEMLQLGPDEPSTAIAELLELEFPSQGARPVSPLLWLMMSRSSWPRRTFPGGWPGEQPSKRQTQGLGGIYARLEEKGHVLDHFIEEVSARMATPTEAELLRLGSGVPVIIVLRTAYDTDGLPVEVCDTTMAADRYVLSYQIPGVLGQRPVRSYQSAWCRALRRRGSGHASTPPQASGL